MKMDAQGVVPYLSAAAQLFEADTIHEDRCGIFGADFVGSKDTIRPGSSSLSEGCLNGYSWL